MPTGECCCKEIAIDFIGELIESKGFYTILGITDQFTKVKYYITTKTTCTATDIADAYINEIWIL